ncbi:phage tail protein [Paenibacillus illinoisensis]|uniref:phage tail protein n=1 Tax=Paenibacillus illinoisensis TaxID=59845 RepID=UPI000FD8EC04|nr:hypothetical protein [Paenibacillus illinoisensis]
MAMTVEELRVLITGETSQLRRDLANVRKQLSNTEREVSRSTGVIKSAFQSLAATLAVLKLGQVFTSATKDAMRFEAAVGQVNRMMGQSVGVFREWVMSQAAAFGMGISEATQYGATYANLISGFSQDQAQTTQRTIDLLKTSAIIASATGREISDVMERIRSGMLGETDAIEDLGINVNVAMLESTEAFRQFAGDSSWQQLSFQTQQTILYYAILEQAARKYGNTLQANTMTRQAMFIAQLKNARLYLGQAFLPIYNTVLPALIAMAKALATAMKWLAAFTTALFGGSSGAGQQVQAAQDQASAIGDLGGAYQTAGDQASGAGSAIKDAGKKAKAAAKEAKAAVAGFDKLNLVGDKGGGASGAEDDGGAGAGGGGASIPDIGGGGMGGFTASDFSGVTGEMDALTEKARAFADTVRKALEPLSKISLEPLKKSLAGLWSALKPFAKNVGQGLVWLYKEALVPLAKWTVEKALPAFIDVLAGAIRVLNSVVEAFKPVADWLWTNFLQPVAAWTGGIIVSALQQLAGGLNSLSAWIDGNQETFLKGAAVVAGFFAAFKIAEFVVAIAPMLATLGEMIASGGLVASVLEGITAALSAVSSPVVLITGLIAALIISFVDLYAESEEFRKQVQELGKTWLAALKPVAEFVKTVLTDAWTKILKPAIMFFVQTVIPNVISIFKQLWQQVLVPLANFIGTVLQPVFKVLSELLTMLWQKIIVPLAQAIGSVLAEAWKGLYQILTVTVMPIINKVITILTQLWKNVINPIIDVLWKNLKPAFSTVFDGIGTVIEGLRKTLTGLIKFVTGVFTGDWKKAWTGVKDIFGGIFESLYGLVKAPLNLIIDGVNKVIDGLNSISVSIPEVEIFGQKVGGGSIGLPRIPKIPRLAKGGLAYGPTLAMVGDNKGAGIDPEVVAPLSKLQGIINSGNDNSRMENLLGQILTALRSSKGDLILQVGTTEIGRVAATGINDIQRRTGVNPLRI